MLFHAWGYELDLVVVLCQGGYLLKFIPIFIIPYCSLACIYIYENSKL